MELPERHCEVCNRPFKGFRSTCSGRCRLLRWRDKNNVITVKEKGHKAINKRVSREEFLVWIEKQKKKFKME